MRRYHVLDGLRGIAALAVVTAHTDTYFGAYTFGESVLAVDLFFCLSGFVIAGAYGARLDRSGPLWFMIVRFIRLYPLYLVGSLFGLAYYLIAPDPSLHIATVIFFSLMMLPTPALPITSVLYPLDFPAWSLLFELGVNLLWATFRKIPRWLVVLVLAGSLGMMALGGVLSRNHSIALGFSWNHLPFGFARAVFSFAIGVLLYRRLQFSALGIGKSARASNAMALAIIAIIFLVLAIRMPSASRTAYELLVVAVVFPAVVYVGAQIAPGPRLTRICTFFGTISYGVYTIHDPLSNLINTTGFGAARYAPFSGIALIGIVGLLAYYLDRVFELPVRQWLIRTWGRGRAVSRLPT